MTRQFKAEAQKEPAQSQGDGQSAACDTALGAPCRRPGALKGLGRLDDSFFEPMTEEELAAWEGGLNPEDEPAVINSDLPSSGNDPTSGGVSGETSS